MNRPTPLTLTLAALLSVGCVSQAPAASSTMPASAHPSTQTATVDRDDVPESEYTSQWRAELQRRRAVQISRLRSYAEARVFPRNDFQPGMASMLVDANGNECAMAHLVMSSGHAALIERLSAENNALLFADVHDGPLYEWILTSGLTREEAAFVQEPDFYIDQQSATAPDMQSIENERLRTHFLAAATQLEMTMDAGVQQALARLGGHLNRPPSPGAY